MKIVIDADIPYIGGLFEPFADVEYVKGGDIKRHDVANADALIVRTRTRCDEGLLGGSRVKIVATATIGVDHIDERWCSANGIKVTSAAGCNARAVAQWVFAALHFVGVERGTIGIVGVGNVGREVENMATRQGFDVVRCDPPRAARGENGFMTLEELLLKADVVTIHVPLLDSTIGMVDKPFLERLKAGAVLLNSSRGEVVDEGALLRSGVLYGLDVWRGEPHINLALLEKAALATPHIAGYSARGKARGTQAVVRDVAQFFGIGELEGIVLDDKFRLENPSDFDISAVDRALRLNPSSFEQLRTIRA